MKDILAAAAADDPTTAERLLPFVYEELRAVARQMMLHEPAGHTLQPTALVHEAYLRLLGGAPVSWHGRGHFFKAAAEAMRRILVERARRYGRAKHGAGRKRVTFRDPAGAPGAPEVDLLALDTALDKLRRVDERKCDVVCLRYFGGLNVEETAHALGISPRTVKSEWRYAKAKLYREIGGSGNGNGRKNGRGA